MAIVEYTPRPELAFDHQIALFNSAEYAAIPAAEMGKRLRERIAEFTARYEKNGFQVNWYTTRECSPLVGKPPALFITWNLLRVV
jgi:hypothetical protein